MGVNMGVSINGNVAAKLYDASLALGPLVNRVVDETSALLLTAIKRNASGRPGPNAPTGDYRRSWTRQKIKDGYNVGTNRPQARRLENGFNGRDSQGRMYNQPPYEHLGPALDEVSPQFVDQMQRVANGVAGLTFGGLR
jgi:hypothetical protein